MNHEFFSHPIVWLIISAICLYLCTILPIRIKNDRVRQLAYWIILIPVSLVIIAYVYPVGIALCKKLAIHWS